MSFHLSAARNRPTAERFSHEARALATRLGFERIVTLHGLAFKNENGVSLVVGPKGVGKSTALRELANSGEAKPLEEGIVLGITSDGNARLIRTGTLEYALHKASIRARIRASSGVRTKYALRSGVQGPQFGEVVAKVLTTPIAVATFRKNGKDTFEPEAVDFDRMLLLTHPLFSPHGISYNENGGVEQVGDDEAKRLLLAAHKQVLVRSTQNMTVGQIIAAIQKFANSKMH